jgi:outer membrane protein assembly factor BamB
MVIPAPVERQIDRPSARVRVWPAVVLVGLFWLSFVVLRWTESPMFSRFVASLAACGLLVLLFTFCWWFSRISVLDRLLGFSVAIMGGAIATFLSPTRVGMIAWFLMTLPVVITAWTAWMLVARTLSPRGWRVGLVVTLLLGWAAFLLIRMEGLSGDGETVIRWRWSPTAEELYLAEREQEDGGPATAGALGSAAQDWHLQPGDWPGFRGPRRDGVVRGEVIATDWTRSAPRLVWRRRVGPAWSSLAVVGDRLFTQEQRGESEAVVCLDARTGREVWSHEDAARFWDGQAGAGPRATPTFAAGRLFALGATGILNCLDAATGKRKWSRNIAADSGAKAPLWGFSGSPLVVSGVVIVFAGGQGDKGLLAYRADTGEPSWAVAAGKASYSSPHLASVQGEEQILWLDERGLVALAPASGAVLWEYTAAGRGMPRSLQPNVVGKGQILIGSEADFGTALIDVARDGKTWSATERWASLQMKPSFNDFVVQDGFIYGFDKNIFCCVDLKTGERRWKKGRYGHGQVLLLAQRRLLLVVSERGEAILVRADPKHHKELGRFQAINGKTWNHPAVARNRLYVRNGEEMACYELGPASNP